jgi:beta-lactamase superfamily II metal-dependent hydrolase
MITDEDFTVTFFDVNGGDGIWIRYKADTKKNHNILIDGGYGKNYYGAFKKVIDKIIELEEVVDLWIITHIDGDHIGAILAFINDSSLKKKENIIRSFWFNHTNFEAPNQSSAISVSQGIKLRAHLATLGIVEESFVDTTVLEQQLHGVHFQILSPLPEKRALANDEWLLEEGATKVSRKKEADHGKTIEELKLNQFVEDDDIPNGSSIAFALKYKCFSGLFLADAHPSDIISSLKSLGYSPENRLKIDFMKVAHHGSKVNTNNELLGLIDCTNYIFSANGISHFHPDKEVLARIITHESRKPEIKINLSFVVDNTSLRGIFDVDKNAAINHNFEVKYPEPGTNYLQLTYNAIQP